MKLAMIFNDRTREQSFYVVNQQVFSLITDKPYVLPGVSSNKLVKDIWNIPFAFNGVFLSGTKSLPKLDVDVVIAVCESAEIVSQKPWFERWRKYTSKGFGKSSEEFLKTIRRAYPNACIIAYQKELAPHRGVSADVLNFFKHSDRVATEFIAHGKSVIENALSKKIYTLCWPYPIEYMRQCFMEERSKASKTLFVGASKRFEQLHGKTIQRGYDSSLQFANMLAKKYDFQVATYDRKMPWEEWLSIIGGSRYCIDLDPVPMLGQVAIDCATLGCVHVGSVMEAAHYLFPALATNDHAVLEDAFARTLTDRSILDEAFKRLQAYHSVSAVTAQLNDVVSEA